MSDLGDQIQDEIDAIKALDTASETPDGQLGDDWDAEYESFADAVQGALSDAERDDHDHSGEAISPQELSVGTDGPATGFEDLGLLAEAGYSQGDVVPQYRTAFVNSDNAQGTTTTYSAFPGVVDDVIPAWSSFDGETVVRANVRVFAGLTSGTHTAQFYNGNNSESIIEVSQTDTDTGITTAWQPYTPPTTGEPLRVYLRCKKGASGDDDYNIQQPMLEIGVRL